MRAVQGFLPTEAEVTISTSISDLPESMRDDAFSHGLNFPIGLECALPQGWPLCQEDAEAEKTGTNYGDDVGFRSFLAYHAIDQCEGGLMHAASEAEKAVIARQVFDNIKHQIIARQLWLGGYAPIDAANVNGVFMNPTLRDTATVPSGYGTAVEPILRIARLVTARQKRAGSGLVNIHGPLVLVPYLIAQGAIRLVGGRYLGPGFIYVTDAGYPDDDNDADDDAGPIQTGSVEDEDQTYFQDAAGTAWLYASGDVQYAWGAYVGKSSIGAPQDNDGRYSNWTTWDGRTNRTMIVVEQQAFLRFDPCEILAGKAYIPSTTQGEGQ